MDRAGSASKASGVIHVVVFEGDVAMTGRHLLAENDHVAAIAQDVGGDAVFVTFNNLETPRNGTRFWGDGFFLKQGLSSIGIVGLKPNWFPRRATDEVIEAVKRHIDGRRVITCGHGQGGYGALKFAASLNASVALSFCPQWSINPADVASFDRRFARYFDPSLDNGLRITEQDLGDRSFVFFDGLERVEALHAEKILGYRGVMPVMAPFSMRDTLRLLADSGSAAEIMRVCARPGVPAPGELRRLIRASRSESTTYHHDMLDRLLARTRKSSTHPSRFVQRSMQRAQCDDPFHRALIAFASGDTARAQVELDQCTSQDFHGKNLNSLWRKANLIRFMAAEALVAEELCATQPNNTSACLNVINHTLIRAGRVERAHAELLRLAKNTDAGQFIRVFVDCSLKLRKTDVLESILTPALTGPMKVTVLFELVNLHNRIGDRPGAFRTLRQLAALGGHQSEDLRRIADELHKIGEHAYALEFREKLLKSAPSDALLALDIVESLIATEILKDKARAKTQLDAIMLTPDLDAQCWVRASVLYDKLQDLDAATRAAETAVSRPGADFQVRCRLVVALLRQRKSSRARQELETLLGESIADPTRLRDTGHLANRLGDPEFSLKFAEAQYRCGHNPHSVLYLAQFSRLAGNRERARELLSALYRAERRVPTLLDPQWVTLAQGLFDAGEPVLARAAAAEAATRDPGNAAVKTLIATMDLVQKHQEGNKTTAPPTITANRPARGIAGWISTRLRRAR